MSANAPARLAIFDLDGTLVDSLADIAAAANAALAAQGLATYPTDQFREFVGWGVRHLIERAAPGLDAETTDALEAGFRRGYSENLVVESAPYPGIVELLGELAGAGVPLAVLSNKPQPLTARVVESLLADHRWVEVRGHRPDCPRKPDPTSLLQLCDAAGIFPGEAVLVGDTRVDIETARRAGTRSIAVTWGFGREHPGATAIASDIDQLRAALREFGALT